MKPESGAVRSRAMSDRDMFREFLHDFYNVRRNLRGRSPDVWQPPTDVYETVEEIVIKVCLPGVKAAQIAVEFNGQVVKICGARNGPDPSSVVAYHQMEIRNGYFERKVMLHKPFDPRGARGEYSDGFLYIRVPKSTQEVGHVLSIRLRF
jgi:HSP20 family protein